MLHRLASSSPVAVALIFLAACGSAPTRPTASPKVPIFDGLGTITWPMSTKNALAQAYFDQGLRLSYAFNHAEAIESFDEAARLDPGFAMPHWGKALALGPNLNQPMSPEHEKSAREAIAKADTMKAGTTVKEQKLIDALVARYTEGGDRAALDKAYAQTMAQLTAEHFTDPEIATLAVAAFMETTPWNYWGRDGKPNPGIADTQALAEKSLQQWPGHAGLIHYYIHLVEASDHAAGAERYADRLPRLMPGAGHMVHMPAHIYFRTGRYADAVRVNLDAIKADESYIAQRKAHGLYADEYYTHNIHFLWAAATLEGRGAMAVEAGAKSTGKACCVGKMLTKGDLATTGLLALVRFGKWDQVLAKELPTGPAGATQYAIAIHHYARALALAAKGQLDDAAKALAALRAIQAGDALSKEMVNFSPAVDVVKIAGNIVEADLAARQKRHDAAIGLLREAVAIEDTLAYTEPPTWHHPVRQILGAIQLEAGKPADAEKSYEEDLKKWPNNGWSLFGLAQSLRAQDKMEAAAVAESRFKTAWQRSDVKLTASVIR
jgi:tetratricopeptide (TPR) repeat protein